MSLSADSTERAEGARNTADDSEQLAHVDPFQWQELRGPSQMRCVRIRLGSARIDRRRAGKLTTGAVVCLEDRADDLVEVLVDDEVWAYGRVVSTRGKLAIQIVELRTARRRKAA